jgi:LemA protein
VIAVIVIVVIVIVLALFLVMTYNGMVRGRNKVDESWSGIDVQLKRRHDLVPNLVETVKGYATHEREVFQAVTDARTRAMNASTPAQAGAAEGILGQAIGRLFAVAEAYPDLKASQNFLELQGTLNQLESEIAASRRVYNSNVQTYNTRIQSFPGVTLAGPFGFSKREFFVIEDASDREPVAVSLSTPPAVAEAPAAPAAPAVGEAPEAPAIPPATPPAAPPAPPSEPGDSGA